MNEKLMPRAASGSMTEFLTDFVALIPHMVFALVLFVVLVALAQLWEMHQARKAGTLQARLDSRRTAQEQYAPMRQAMQIAANCQPRKNKKTKCLKA